MARVSIDQSALTDPRFTILGREIGADRYAALGRMLTVWNYCQESASYVLAPEILDALHSDVNGFAAAVVKAGLGTIEEGGIYLRGTRGRIEWLENKRRAGRENGKLGGRPSRTEQEPKTNQDRLRTETPPALASALAPVPKQKKQKNPFLADSPQLQLASMLADGIRRRDPGKSVDLQQWAATIDLIIRIDRRSPDQIRSVIDWAMRHTKFWSGYIVSAERLRQKFSDMVVQQDAESDQTPAKKKGAPHGSFDDFDNAPRFLPH